MTQPDQKYVASTRPVNRRTATKRPLQLQSVNPLVQERLSAVKASSRFGRPLTEQLGLNSATTRRIPLHPLTVIGSVIAAVSTIALFLAWLQVSMASAVIGVAGLSVGLVLVFRSHNAATAGHAETALPLPLFDEDCLKGFDNALRQMAPEVSEDIAVRLTEIKQQIVRIARQTGVAAVDEDFTMEDRLYLMECVRRYLPDSLQSYLMVPRDQRSAQILDQGHTAASLLHSQLELLGAQLKELETKMAKSAGAHLLKQQRFLEAKRRH